MFVLKKKFIIDFIILSYKIKVNNNKKMNLNDHMKFYTKFKDKYCCKRKKIFVIFSREASE